MNPTLDQRCTPAHPFAEIFALHDGDPLCELAKRIESNGLREEIVLLEGRILDGRRRERACLKAGISPKYRKFGSRPSDGIDPLEFVIDTNLHRRHLGEGERALAAARYATHKNGKPHETALNTGSKPSQNEKVSPTNAQAAEKFEVSEATVHRAKKVVANGTDKLQKAVAKEEITVSDAAKVADEPAKVQNKAVDEVINGTAKTATEAAKKINTTKNGKPVFDDRIIDSLIGKLTRAFDARGNAIGKGDEHAHCIQAMSAVVARWDQWQHKTAR